MALHKKSESGGRSAKGAKYDSQGQALSNAKRVAPGQRYQLKRALKVRNIGSSYSALSELHAHYAFTQGRRTSRCSALAPGYHISRLWRSNDFLCKAGLRLEVLVDTCGGFATVGNCPDDEGLAAFDVAGGEDAGDVCHFICINGNEAFCI